MEDVSHYIKSSYRDGITLTLWCWCYRAKKLMKLNIDDIK